MRIEDIILTSVSNDEAIIIEDKKDKWSKKKIINRILQEEALLKEQGYGPGDHIAIISENGSEFIVSLFAILRINAVAIPIDPQLPQVSVEGLLEISNSKGICISDYYRGKLSDILESKYCLITEGRPRQNVSCASVNGFSEKEIAMILFSSGTSEGMPKGVVLTHEAISYNVKAIFDYMQPTKDDIFYITKTMVHVSTLVGEILVGLYSGSKIIAYPTIMTPQSIINNIEATGTTIIAVNPTILKILVRSAESQKRTLPILRLVYTSGGVVETDVLIDAERVFNNAQILNVYGLTEAGPRVCAQRGDDQTKIYGAVGRPIKGVRIKVIKEDGTEAKIREQGGIYVCSKSCMIGYYQNDHLTHKKLKNGWLDTGDYGYIADNGELIVLGRSDDVIVRNGNNVDPVVVENSIKKMPGIIDCVVFGGNDDGHGECIVAAIVCARGWNYSLQEIITFCNKLLAPFEIPHKLLQWECIPMTTNGKVSRKAAKKIFENEERNKL